MKKTQNKQQSKNIPLTLLSKSIAETRGKLHLDADSTVLMRGDAGRNYTCEKCGAILLEKVPRLMMSNGAIRCNRCGVYSSSEKPSIYIKKPTTLDDLASLSSPTNRYEANDLWTQHLYKDRFGFLYSQFLGEFQHHQGDRPKVLYHYTTFPGLEGILKTGTFWLTDIAYLNDASEMQVAIDTIEGCLSEIKPNASELGKELLSRTTVTTSPKNAAQGFYVGCFCKNGDLLSQWRAYGAGGGGYALGFNSHDLGTNGFLVRKIIYDPDVQKNMVTWVVNETLTLLQEICKNMTIAKADEGNTLPAFAAFLSDLLKELLFIFKHQAFSEEDEWRVIFDFHRSAHINALCFRNATGFPVPYVAAPLSLQEKGMPPLPLVEVVHGPTLHPDLTQKALHLILERYNYEFVEVRGSIAPLRP